MRPSPDPAVQYPYSVNNIPQQSQYMTPLPTGMTAGPAQAPVPSTATPPSAINMLGVQTAPQILQDTAFMPGFLRTQIGKRVRVEFLIGTTGLTDRIGILIGVGASYILLRDPQEDNIIMCDLYSIKFVTILL